MGLLVRNLGPFGWSGPYKSPSIAALVVVGYRGCGGEGGTTVDRMGIIFACSDGGVSLRTNQQLSDSKNLKNKTTREKSKDL